MKYCVDLPKDSFTEIDLDLIGSGVVSVTRGIHKFDSQAAAAAQMLSK